MGTGKILWQYNAAESEAMAAEFERAEMTWRAAHSAEEPAASASERLGAADQATRASITLLLAANRRALMRFEEAQCAWDKLVGRRLSDEHGTDDDQEGMCHERRQRREGPPG